MSVIFFTYAYPPLKYPRSIQIHRLLKYSAHPIRVICCADDSPTDATIADLDAKNPCALDVFRRKAFSRVDPRRLIEHLSIPDALVFWARETAYRVLSRGLVAGGDVLVTFGQPMSSHLAGLRIKRETGASWIAHFSDPWVDNPFRRRLPLTGILNRSMERSVIESAERAVFTSEETLDLVMDKYPISWRKKAVVIPHSFDAELYGPDIRSSREIIIRYLGDFYGSRSPDVLVQALEHIHRTRAEALRDTRVELIGNISGEMAQAVACSSLPSGRIVVRGPTDYRTSLRLMRQANLLLVIDAPFEKSVFLPSKLIEYIGAERPIFAITPRGTAWQLVRELGGFVADPSDSPTVSRQLLAAISAARECGGGFSLTSGVCERYEARGVAARFDALLDEVAAEKGTAA